ncbi:hypothetical protein EZV62_006841 [Acer yangbiense]|uniref:Disease resistance protein winged helix domain-containing protein n=1 Tax=Acer yangbiense TaxID=1000413 RepID=A0A5C7IAZ5_9ROSI|nr:hypothetical protein EZV62_006841 [Acer yangbiense]
MPQDENPNMEDVAKDNFLELINRSLIQIGKISWGRVATCRVHDLLRELAIEKARELNLLYIYDQTKHSTDLYTLSNDTELSNEISKLQELRHLFGRFDGNLEIESLTKLQSLKSLNTEKLGNLRELWIFGRMETTNVFCFDSIAKLNRLEQLVVILYGNDYFASLQPLTLCSNLIDLRLEGKMEKLPEDIHRIAKSRMPIVNVFLSQG